MVNLEYNVNNQAHNSTYKKLAVQWLNNALCFVSISVLVSVSRFEFANFL